MSLPSINQVDVESWLLVCCWLVGNHRLVVLKGRGQCHPLHMSVPSNKIPQAENGIALINQVDVKSWLLVCCWLLEIIGWLC